MEYFSTSTDYSKPGFWALTIQYHYGVTVSPFFKKPAMIFMIVIDYT